MLKTLAGTALLLLLLLPACQSDIETIETRDDQNRLVRYERRKKDFAKQGVYQRFYETGTICEEAHYANDVLEGVRKYFLPNGTLESSESYKNGVIDGPYHKYYENGTLQLEQSYANGALEGPSIRYYPNGQIRDKVVLKNNEEDGPFAEYYENGTLMTEGTYGPGEEGPLEQGELKEYDSTGVLIRIADCKDGRCFTRWKKDAPQ